MKIPTPEFIKKDQLNHHERMLVKCALVGKVCHPIDHKKMKKRLAELSADLPRQTRFWLAARPEESDAGAPEIRAELIRFLALGGNDDHPVDPYGVWLTGARITGTLTLEGCRDLRTLSLMACHFDKEPNLLDAAGHVINFSGSYGDETMPAGRRSESVRDQTPRNLVETPQFAGIFGFSKALIDRRIPKRIQPHFSWRPLILEWSRPSFRG